MTWLFSLPIYVPPNYAAVGVLAIAGVASASLALSKSKTDFTSFPKKYYLLLLPLVVSCLLLPFPYDLGPLLLLIGFVTIYLSSRWYWLAALSLGLFFCGGILIAQSLVPHFFTVFTSKSHQFTLLSPVIYRFLDWLNLPVSLSQGTVFVRTMRELHAFTTTWDKMALFPFLNLLVGGGIVIWLFSKAKALKPKAISLSWFFLAGVLYLVIRYIFMVLLFVYLMYFVGYYEEVSKMDIFWNPAVTAVTFVPFWLVVRKLFPLESWIVTRKLSFHPLSRRHLIAGALLCLSAFLIVGSVGFHDPGKEKPGRILIDERHSKWEITTKKYDTKWYGAESGYNYYCMAEYLNYYYSLDRNFEEITPDLLSGYDVLVLKIPTEPFSKEEVQAIVQFVKKGGGLWLIGEHTNVFGSSAYLNPIARQFNFSFRYDCLFDIKTKFEQVYVPPKLLPHPIVQNMPPFLFAVSCSIEPASYFIEKPILATGLWSLNIDYHSANFYPQVKHAANMDFGAFVQMVAAKHGKGRVAAFTDSTVFSNFSAFIPGKPELLLATIGWLNKQNQLWWLNFLFLFLAIMSVASAFTLLRKLPKDLRFLSLVVISGVGIIATAICLFTAINKANYPLPEPHTKPTFICFEKDHGNYELPLLGFVKDYKRSYSIFYQWVLRLGYFPQVRQGTKDCLESGDLVVIINPRGEFTLEDAVAYKGYVSRGGKILLMDDPANTDSSANSLLQAFNMKVKAGDTIRCTTIYDASRKNSWQIGPTYVTAVEGGKGLLFTEEGKAVLSIKKEGQGAIVVMTFSNSLVDSQMGMSERVVPDKRLQRLFELEFRLLRGMIDGNLETELSAPLP